MMLVDTRKALEYFEAKLNFTTGPIDDLERLKSLGRGEARVLPEPPCDVLDVYDGVVDQRSHRDRHTAFQTHPQP